MDNHTQILIAEKLYNIAANVQDIADLLNPGNQTEVRVTPPSSIFNLNVNTDDFDEYDNDDEYGWDDDDDDEDEDVASVFSNTRVFPVFSALA